MKIKPKFGIQWHITDRCDQRCKHCFIFRGKDKKLSKEFDYKSLISILDNFIVSCNMLEVEPFLVITGGDPLLHKDIWELLSVINYHNISFSLLGNPFHLNYDVVHRLEQLGCSSYQMSLDGLEKTHDFIRRPGSFNATLDSLKYFNNSSIATAIMSTVSNVNIFEIPQLVDIIVSNNVDKFVFARYCPMPDEQNLMISPEDYKAFLNIMWRKYVHYKNSDTEFPLKDHLWKLYLYERGLFDIVSIENADNLIIDGCHCGITHVTVLTDGTVYACRRCNSPVGEVPKRLLSEIFHSAEMDKYRRYDEFEACSKCALRNFCRGCPAIAKCLTNDFYAKDPQCWK